MNIILVGTDFDESSEKALKQAANLARKYEARIHLLHVLEPVDEPGSDDPETQEFYQKLEKKSMDKLKKEIESLQGLEVTSSVRVGHRHPAILGAAEEMSADLIVLGSHPIGPEDNRIATSHRVAVTAPIPVLLVP